MYHFLIGFNALKLRVDGNFNSDAEYEGVDISIRTAIFVYASVSSLFCVSSLQRPLKDESVQKLTTKLSPYRHRGLQMEVCEVDLRSHLQFVW